VHLYAFQDDCSVQIFILHLCYCKLLQLGIGVNANLELVVTFCYLGDMLSVDGDADAAVETRIRIGWNKFMQLDHGLRIRIYH